MLLQRVIIWFNLHDDTFVDREVIDAPVELLTKNFDVVEDDIDVVLVYKVTPSNVDFVQKYIMHRIDFEKYEYFLECYDLDYYKDRNLVENDYKLK